MEAPIASRRLLVEERRRLIVDLVEKQGRATVEELATRFGTSTVTIRADLDALARSSAIA
ncbi:DeoR family transcriptional regulator, partial [Rhodanobacter denitrificans]|nr:DeoR family transcriptional regulator [Rhodanobacter denitrificans]